MRDHVLDLIIFSFGILLGIAVGASMSQSEERKEWCEIKYELKADYDTCLKFPDWKKK